MTQKKPDVSQLLKAGEELKILTDTDIAHGGSFGVHWLAVTNERLLALSQNGGDVPVPSLDLLLKDIKTVATRHVVGQVILEAVTKRNQKIEVIRSSNSLTERMAKIAKGLNDTCAEDKPLAFHLEEEESRHCSSCGRLLPEKGSFCPACLKKRKVWARFWKYARPHRVKVLMLMASTILSTAMGLAPPYLTKILVDDVLKPGASSYLLLVLVLGLIGVNLGSHVIGIAYGRLSAWLGAKVSHEIRFDFYQAVQGLTLRRHDKTQTGALISRLNNDAGMLNFLFTDFCIGFIPMVLQLFGICVMLFILNWRLALLVVIPTPGVVFLTWSFSRRMHSLYSRVWQRRARMTARANDTISGIRVVKAFAQEPTEIDQFGKHSDDLYKATACAEGMWATAFPIIAFVTTLGTFLIWYVGGLGVMGKGGAFIGPISLGTLIAYIGYLGMFYQPLQMLTRFTDYLNRGITAAQRLFEITDSDQEIYENPEATEMPEPRGDFSFENVHFCYLKDRPVLKGVTVDVKAGEMIGLVGRSGVGKSTLINMICRFYDPDEGVIRLDGVDLRNIRLRDIRRHIGIVPQEPFLFNAPIGENIAYGNPAADREDIMRAAMAANAHGFILRQPDGYDTRVGERGSRLSGG